MLSCRAAQVAPTICALALLSQVSSAQPPAAQPSAAQPSAAQPSAAQPSAAQPSAAQPSAAQPRIAVTLDYQAPPGCPAEAEFRDLVAARVGYDPFSAAATLKLQVQLSAQAGQVRGVWKIAEPPQRRELKVT